MKSANCASSSSWWPRSSAAEKIEPLPDIDFNIRAGNTLVGFASLDEVKKTQEGTLGFGKGEVARIEEEAEIADRAFRKFREMQTEQGMSPRQFAEAKEELRVAAKEADRRARPLPRRRVRRGHPGKRRRSRSGGSPTSPSTGSRSSTEYSRQAGLTSLSGTRRMWR